MGPFEQRRNLYSCSLGACPCSTCMDSQFYAGNTAKLRREREGGRKERPVQERGGGLSTYSTARAT